MIRNVNAKHLYRPLPLIEHWTRQPNATTPRNSAGRSQVNLIYRTVHAAIGSLFGCSDSLFGNLISRIPFLYDVVAALMSTPSGILSAR